jgi:uncharacterized protein (UPF0218 family)
VSDQLIIVVGGVITAAIVALGGVLVAIVNSRTNRTTPSPPAPLQPDSDHVLYERTAVLARRADDADERDEVQDRRLEHIERVLDVENPEWRHR